MIKSKRILIYTAIILAIVGGVMGIKEIFKAEKVNKAENLQKQYKMPLEDEKHEGTWIQWPHNYTYGKGYMENVQDIWIEITKALCRNENVHIIVYNEKEKNEVEKLLKENTVNIDNVNFYEYKTDDVWVRDNGPIFAYDNTNELTILDFGFNGWGKKEPFKKSNSIPKKIGEDLGLKVIDLNGIVLEGGSYEMDGSGSFLATRSSIVNDNRNAGLSEKEIEEYLSKVYGIRNFIWLDGVIGLDITDFHIDGFARFLNDKKIITLNDTDLEKWGLKSSDRSILLNAKNSLGEKYIYEYLPLTKENVTLKDGTQLDYPGSYLNYYVANGVVIVPNYNDENDKVANSIIKGIYKDREVIGIDVRELYKEGGMIHCITQQQPVK